MPRLVKAGLNIIIDISFRTIALQLSRGLISFNWSIELNKLRQTAFSNSLCHGCRNGTRALIFLARMEQERSTRANISSRAKKYLIVALSSSSLYSGNHSWIPTKIHLQVANCFLWNIISWKWEVEIVFFIKIFQQCLSFHTNLPSAVIRNQLGSE